MTTPLPLVGELPDLTGAACQGRSWLFLTECRDWAFDTDQPGFLGGLTEVERREIRRRR